MPHTTPFSRGDVVLIRFPFTDLGGSKQRPAVVLSSDAHHAAGEDVLLAAITSQRVDAPGPFDHPLPSWEEHGLLHPSAVRAGKITTLHRSMVRKVLGRIGEDDLAIVDRKVTRALGFE